MPTEPIDATRGEPGTGTGGKQKFPQEVMEKFNAILNKYKRVQGSLITAMQETQVLFGYLPKGAMVRISEEFAIPISQIYGVATFYAQFHLEPRGRNVIRICQGTACHVRGAKEILNAIEKELGIKAGQSTPDLRFTLETVACIGACGLAPVMMINDDTHGRLTPEKVVEILRKYE